VFLHGFTGDATSFDAVRAEVPGQHLCPELLGHGDAPLASDSWDSEVARIGALIDRTPRPRVLVGYSLGARVAAGLLVAAPHRFERAVLVGPNLGIDDAQRPARTAWEQQLATRLRRDGVASFVDHWQALPLWDSQRSLPDEVLAAQRAVRTRHTAEGLARSLEVLGLGVMPDLRDGIARLSVPVTLLVGALDHKFLALSEPWCRWPHLTRRVVSDCGHNVVLERPDVVAEAARGR
jgi:2-succinyl-6-hydroxy-2,4-cyclohexadiene-1-carboxylate synthase